jgi:hypothetical protein
MQVPATIASPGVVRAARINPLELAGIALLIALSVLYVIVDNDSFFNFWTDRDMVRSEMLLKEFQWMGAELSYGSAARVPGGALHYLWVWPTLISKDPKLSYQFCVLLGMLSLIPLYWAMRRSFGVTAAVVATMVLLASPILFGTLTRLWNPSFQAPFIILTFAFLVRILSEGDTASFKWMIGSLVLGMQMHLSTYLLVICVALALVVTRTRIPWREALAALGLTIVLLAPYLIGEISTGFDNVAQMTGSQGRGAIRGVSLSKGIMYNPDNVGDVWRWYMLAFGMNDDLPASPLHSMLSILLNMAILLGALYTAIAAAYWLEWGKPIAYALNVPVAGGWGKVLVASIIPVLIGFLYFSYSPQVELVVYGSARYLMFAMPGLAIIAGLGAAALVTIGREHRIAQALLVLPVIAAVVTPAYALATSLRALDKPWNEPGRDFMGALDQVQQETKWKLEDVVARSSVLRRHDTADDRWRFENIFGIGYELHRYNIAVPFSRKGECAAYLTGGHDVYGDKGMSRDALMRSFEQPGLNLDIIRQKRVGSDSLVIYHRNGGSGYCLTTVHNRYVLSGEEKAMFERYGKLDVGAAETTTKMLDAAKPRQQAFILNLGPTANSAIFAMVKLANVNNELEIEFHSNQLRGDTYNGGFLDIGMIGNVRLKFAHPLREPIEVPIEKGLVGGKGTFTPLKLAHDLPAGTYSLSFEADVYPMVRLGTWPVDFNDKKPVSIPVTQRFNVWN